MKGEKLQSQMISSILLAAKPSWLLIKYKDSNTIMFLHRAHAFCCVSKFVGRFLLFLGDLFLFAIATKKYSAEKDMARFQGRYRVIGHRIYRLVCSEEDYSHWTWTPFLSKFLGTFSLFSKFRIVNFFNRFVVLMVSWVPSKSSDFLPRPKTCIWRSSQWSYNPERDIK